MTPDRLDFDDRDAVAEWLTALEATANDLMSIAHDQTDPPGRRELGRALAGRMAAEASSAIDALIAHARAGLDDDEPDSGDPAGSGSAGPAH